MATKQLGIGMIEMYSKMIAEEFAPIISQLNARRSVETANMEIQVRKELGIYNRTIKKFKLEAELAELNRQLKVYEENSSYERGGWCSKIDEIVNAKMEATKNGLLKETEVIRDDLIKRIKLAGVHGDIKTVFDDLSALIAPLQKKLKALPMVKPKKMLKK
jgi:hypothetical protein